MLILQLFQYACKISCLLVFPFLGLPPASGLPSPAPGSSRQWAAARCAHF